jgi:hypothetical protein
MACSPQANYTDWATAACRRSYFKEIAAPVKKTETNGRGDQLRWPRDTLYPQRLGKKDKDYFN